MSLYLLYIDPGTGSALFSIIIGAAAAGYFLLRTVFLTVKTAVLGRAKTASKNYHPCVMYCEGPQYCNVFKPALDEFEKRGVDVLYFTSAENDPAFEAGYTYIKSEYIGEGNKAFARLNFLSAGVVLSTTPGLDVYQWRRSKTVKHYCHIVHAAGDDTVMYRMYGIDFYDSVLLSGDVEALGRNIRCLEKRRGIPEKELVSVGCPYLDVLAEKLKHIPLETGRPFTVLIASSWGASSLLTRYGETLLNPLLAAGLKVIVRPHPQSKLSERAMLEQLEARYKSEANLEWDYERENIFSLARADVMISDFSGVIFDFICLFDKPVLCVNSELDFRPYDAYSLEGEPWMVQAERGFAVALREAEFNDVEEIIRNAVNDKSLQEARKRAKETAWCYPGEAGRRIADFMIAKAQSLGEAQ